MAELVHAELVRPIVPERYDQYLVEAAPSFLEFVDADPLIAERARAGLGSVAAPRGGAPAGTVMKIHGGKLGHDVENGLTDRGLARRASDGPWLEVEARTASAYMAFLAKGLGSLDDVEMDPITDRLANLAAFADSEPADDPVALANALTIRVLEGVLPGPAESVSVAELANFKEEHGDLLARFRARLESHLLGIAEVTDEQLRERRLLILTEELQAELEEVEARMQSRNWPRLVFGTFCGVLGAAIPVGAALATGAIPVAAAGAPGLVSAVYSAMDSMRSGDEFRRSPMAYAALAREHLAA